MLFLDQVVYESGWLCLSLHVRFVFVTASIVQTILTDY